jgi:hypothetical protein
MNWLSCIIVLNYTVSPEQLKSEIAANFQIVKDRSNDEEICIICPVPGCGDKNGNRSINVKTLHTNCWRCGSKQPHHVKTLFQSVGLEFEDNHILEPSELLEMLRPKPGKVLTPVQDVPLPEGFELLSENRDSCYWRFCREMAERKHLSIEDLEEAQAGFTRFGNWEPFCIFPVIEGPRIVYYQGRRYSDEGEEKTKKFPSRKEVPWGVRYWIYNLEAISPPAVELVIIVESILNVLSLKRRLRELGLLETIVPICVFSHYISQSHLTKMKAYKHIKDWCILFDSDSTELAHTTAMALNPLLPTSVAEMPHGKNSDGSPRLTNDANDDVDAALRAIDARQRSKPDRLREKIMVHPLDRTPWRRRH